MAAPYKLKVLLQHNRVHQRMKRRKGGLSEPLGLDKEEDCCVLFLLRWPHCHSAEAGLHNRVCRRWRNGAAGGMKLKHGHTKIGEESSDNT